MSCGAKLNCQYIVIFYFPIQSPFRTSYIIYIYSFYLYSNEAPHLWGHCTEAPLGTYLMFFSWLIQEQCKDNTLTHWSQFV